MPPRRISHTIHFYDILAIIFNTRKILRQFWILSNEEDNALHNIEKSQMEDILFLREKSIFGYMKQEKLKYSTLCMHIF